MKTLLEKIRNEKFESRATDESRGEKFDSQKNPPAKISRGEISRGEIFPAEISPPKIPAAVAMPCLLCGCPIFWESIYAEENSPAEIFCGECEPPPSRAFARRWWIVASLPDALTWLPFDRRDTPHRSGAAAQQPPNATAEPSSDQAGPANNASESEHPGGMPWWQMGAERLRLEERFGFEEADKILLERTERIFAKLPR